MIHTDACCTPGLSQFAYLNIIVFVSQFLLQKVHSLYQNEFFRQCDQVLLILIPNNFPLLYAYQVADYVFFPVLQFPTLFP